MKKTSRKLKLGAESVRIMDASELGRAAGAATAIQCGPYTQGYTCTCQSAFGSACNSCDHACTSEGIYCQLSVGQWSCLCTING